MSLRRCDVCGHRWDWDYDGPTSCPKCAEAEVAIGKNWDTLMGWVQAVATKAAEDAVQRHENEEEHG